MIAKFMEFEERYLGNSSPVVPASPLVALADRFMRKLNDTGPMSREELVNMAVKEGFFPDAESAVQGVHPMLASLLRSELIRDCQTEPTRLPPCRRRSSFEGWSNHSYWRLSAISFAKNVRSWHICDIQALRCSVRFIP